MTAVCLLSDSVMASVEGPLPLAESTTPALAALRASTQRTNRVVMDGGGAAIEIDSVLVGKKISMSAELQRAVGESTVVGGYRL